MSLSEREAIGDAWADAAAADDGDDAVLEVAASDDLAGTLDALSQRVTLAAIGARRGGPWMLHAAGLALPDGRVVALVGPSGRGKTTAARVLGRAYGYVSDETVAIEPDGVVRPYRKPLSIIESQGAPKAQRSPSSLGLLPLPEVELRLAAVVLLDRRDDGPEEPQIEPVDFGDALEELVEQSSYLPDLPAPLQTMAALAAAVGGVQRVTYREAESLVGVLERVAVPGSTSVARPLDENPLAAATASAGSAYFRTPTRDALALDDPDRLALLHVDEDGDGTVRMLAGIAPALWRAAGGASTAELVAAAVAAHGAPDDADAEALVIATVDELVGEGVLELREPRWRIGDEVAWTDDGYRIVVLGLDDPELQPCVLEGSAALIWRALAAGGTLDELTGAAADAVGVDPGAVAADVAAFISQLATEGLAGSA
ncbi:hypothetical protein GCM10025738_21450 [Microbacterium fluvii]